MAEVTPFVARLKTDVKLTYDAIFRLSRVPVIVENTCTEVIPPADMPMDFEIGVWDAVPVESRKRRKTKSTVEREPVDFDNIDYNSHLLTPPIQNMKQPRIPPKEHHPSDNLLPFLNIYKQQNDCFCHTCLICVNMDPVFPATLIKLSWVMKQARLHEITRSSEQFFYKMVRILQKHQVSLPLELPNGKISYEKMLEFFEKNCRPESRTMDMALILSEQVAVFEKKNWRRQMYKLHEIFKTLVFASASKVLFKTLIAHVPAHRFRNRVMLFTCGVRKPDPYHFLRLQYPNESPSLEQKVLNLYPKIEL